MPNFLVTADTDLTTESKHLTAWHFRATAAAVIAIRDGSVTGDIIVPIELAINTSASQSYSAPNFLEFPLGVFVDVVSGTVVGSVSLT